MCLRDEHNLPINFFADKGAAEEESTGVGRVLRTFLIGVDSDSREERKP